MSISPGSIASAMPPSESDAARKQRDLARAQREQAVALVAAQTQIGSGGLLVNGGGSITIDGTGSLNVGSGALNSAGSISAATTITAGGNITGGGLISNGGITAVGGMAAGGTVSGATVSSSGAVSGTTGTFNTGLFSTAAYSTVVSGTRTATWTQIDGTIGTAPSSIRFKTNVVDAVFDETRMQAILGMSLKYYNYKAEIARRDDQSDPNYVGSDYHVHQEFGALAEDLHAAGLWEFVVYEREEDGQAKLDSAGNVIPFAINYDLLSLAAIAVTQFLWAKQQAMAADIAAIKAHLGL